MLRRGVRCAVALAALAVGACASSDVGTGNIDAADSDARGDAPDDAPTDAAIDAIDACVPMTETCNGADDDCDGQIDDDFATLGDACMAGSGACVATGRLVCNAAGTGVECDAVPGTGGAETCNGVNDDCDAATDEGFNLGTMCDGADADLCAEGAIVCAGPGATVCGDTTADSVESCNGANDDCDALTDEGFNLGTPCDGADSDACVEGMITCAGDGTATCSDVSAGTVEVCNGLDDDCQAGVDNGYAVGTTCSAGVGQCLRSGTNQCNAAGNGVTCNATPGAPIAEVCGDGVDQDCNGADAMCPTNDLPGGAINISGGGTFNADLTVARNDQDFTGTSCGFTGGRDVFYTFTLPAPEVVYADTFGSNFDTVVRIFNGSCTALGANRACYDDACSVLQTQGAIQLAAGTYCLVLDQYSSAQTLGNATLTFTRAGRTGTAIATGTGTVNGTTVGGANVTQAGTCAIGVSQGPDVAYHFLACPAQTFTVAANTCASAASWDSVLYLRKAPSPSDLACNDDSATACGTASPIRLSNFTGASAAGPGLFWLTVDGYNGASGAYTLNYTIQ